MNLALDLQTRNRKLGHQSSASARLLNRLYHLSANAISQLLRCIYTAEGCCYGDMLWWLFDVTRLHQGNRVASVRAAEEWGGLALATLCMCVSHHFLSASPLLPLSLSHSLSCLAGCSLFHTNILVRSSSLLLCTSYCVFGLAPLSPFWEIKQIKEENLRRKKPVQQHY